MFQAFKIVEYEYLCLGDNVIWVFTKVSVFGIVFMNIFDYMFLNPLHSSTNCVYVLPMYF